MLDVIDGNARSTCFTAGQVNTRPLRGAASGRGGLAKEQENSIWYITSSLDIFQKLNRPQ